MDSVKKLIREMFLYGIFGLFSASMDTLSFFLLSKTSIPLLLSNFLSLSKLIRKSWEVCGCDSISA